MEPKPYPPLRPTQYAEHILVTSILNGTYPAGAVLPGERDLANAIGITRPTLRETLQRLASEGWVQIQHGKPTVINDFWLKGGLSMLGTLAKYADFLPNGFITRLLEVRVTLLPPVARLAAVHRPQKILEFLESCPQPADSVETYAAYDWNLQMCMARESGNPIYALILNDFASIFQKMAARYFRAPKPRKASLRYYRHLARAIERRDHSVEQIVKKAMEQSIVIWQEVKRSVNT
jgi:GntR family transcriptional regulator, negative regulator for fad regulon and positive regulator of fabA